MQCVIQRFLIFAQIISRDLLLLVMLKNYLYVDINSDAYISDFETLKLALPGPPRIAKPTENTLELNLLH